MDKKTFDYKNYKNCYFEVGNYFSNQKAMSIQLMDEEGESITVCTVNMTNYFYAPNTATIKNYSENSGMTAFLKKLGVIETIYSSVKCNPYAQASETIDFCEINVEKLKEYSKSYKYEFKI